MNYFIVFSSVGADSTVLQYHDCGDSTARDNGTCVDHTGYKDCYCNTDNCNSGAGNLQVAMMLLITPLIAKLLM